MELTQHFITHYRENARMFRKGSLMLMSAAIAASHHASNSYIFDPQANVRPRLIYMNDTWVNINAIREVRYCKGRFGSDPSLVFDIGQTSYWMYVKDEEEANKIIKQIYEIINLG